MADDNILKQFLTGSPVGIPQKIGATSAPGDTVHIPVDSPKKDEIWIFASNVHTLDVELRIQFGAAADHIIVSIPARQGLHRIMIGNIIQGNTNPITAHADVADVIYLFCFSNEAERI